jgi:hypothetical protein
MESEEGEVPMATLGGVHESRGAENSVDTENLARFAVEEHNKKEVSQFGCISRYVVRVLYMLFSFPGSSLNLDSLLAILEFRYTCSGPCLHVLPIFN